MKLQRLVQLLNQVDSNLYYSNHMLVQDDIVININLMYLGIDHLSIMNLIHIHQHMPFIYNHLIFLNSPHL